nr:MAG TPA: hypothetical protein [Caudoviricetes sp.]
MASLLLILVFSFLTSFNIFSSLGSLFCLANASICQARQISFSNCSLLNFSRCFPISDNSYGVYNPIVTGSILRLITSFSQKANKLKEAASIPPYLIYLLFQMLMLMLRQLFLQFFLDLNIHQ